MAPSRVLVVGDRFIHADLFAEGVEREASALGIAVVIDQLQLPYPAVNSVPLPRTAPATTYRPLWEDPTVVIARATADDAADPVIREYTGPVDALAPHLAGVDAVIVHLAPLSRNGVGAADRLRAVGCARGGAVNLNVPALNERAIPIFYCPGRNARAVAEYIMGAVLALTRSIAAGAAAIEAGRWRLDLYAYELVGPELYGQTCGLIGFGGVGQAFAPIARGFGLRLLVHDPYVAEAAIREAGAEPASLDDVLRAGDLVVIAARLTDQSRGMIGPREFSLLKPSCIFVNAARAELVDGATLGDLLQRRAIAGAVIDVFSPEPPLAVDPLVGLDHVLLTPHIAGASREAAHRGADTVCRNVVAFLADGSLTGCLNLSAVQSTKSNPPGEAS